MSYSEPEILRLFRESVFAVKLLDVGEVRTADHIAQLGLDSVSTMEVVGRIEEQLGVRFPDEDLATLQTVGDLVALVRRSLEREREDSRR